MDIQFKISTLKAIIEKAESLHQSTENHHLTIPVVRITKTADRQYPDIEDKYETSLLTTGVFFELLEDA